MVVPNEKPPPAAVLFAGVPKLKAPVALVVAWVAVPNVKPPPEAAGVELASPNTAVGAAAVVFWAPKVKPPVLCPKLNPPLILFTGRIKKSKVFLLQPGNLQNGHFLSFGGSQCELDQMKLPRRFLL